MPNDRFHYIRNEIASCEEAAYESLPLKEAATLLFFKSQTDLMNFAQQVRFMFCISVPAPWADLNCVWIAGVANQSYSRNDHFLS